MRNGAGAPDGLVEVIRHGSEIVNNGNFAHDFLCFDLGHTYRSKILINKDDDKTLA